MMHRQYAKRQTTNTDPTAVPSVSGIDGSLTAGEPSGTKLVVGSGTGTPSTDGPDFAAGRFVSVSIDLGIFVLTTRAPLL